MKNARDVRETEVEIVNYFLLLLGRTSCKTPFLRADMSVDVGPYVV